MKKLLVVAPLSVMLAACSSMSMPNPFKNKNSSTVTNTQTEKAYDRAMPKRFSCEDGASLMAKYSLDGEEAKLTATLPKAQWVNQSLTMELAPAASGARYVNTTVSDNVNYSWHTKNDFGIMTLQWADGQEYSVKCKSMG